MKSSGPVASKTSASRGRKWWFRLAALLTPPLLLIALECGLRLVGYGHSTEFFLKRKIAGRAVFIENQDYARRFFPPGLARTPQPTVIPAVKATDTCRVFVFGESAAMGDPEPAFGFGRILEVLLRERFPGTHFEVVNVAVTAINSHVIREIAKDCAPREGDVWILYLGNNEVVGPFGAGTVFGAQAPSVAFARANIALRATRLAQLFERLKHRLQPKPADDTSWKGMEMFLDQQVRDEDPRLAVVYRHFQRNLEDILDIGAASGAKVLLSTIVSNLRDSPPFASLHRRDLAAANLVEWDRLFKSGIGFEAETNHPAAIAQYEQAAKIDDRYAELHFRLGRCLQAMGRKAEARRSFEKARDLDTLRFRADTRINDIIRETARKRGGERVKFLDAVERFAQNSSQGLTGEEFLFEHVHLNFDGNYLLARAAAEQLAGWLPVTNAAARADLLSREECARHLAFTDWDRHQVLDEMISRLEQPPFSAQLDHEAREKRLKKQRAELQKNLHPEAMAIAVGVYQQALALSPEDWVLHENFARLLQETGENIEAEKQWRTVIAMVPQNAQACYSLGSVLEAQGRSVDAATFFRQTLRRRPDSPEARNALALALAAEGKIEDAIRQYKDVLRQHPKFVEARINLGQLLAGRGRMGEAESEYEKALLLSPTNVAAHINLGKLLANAGKLSEATAHYREAVRLAPENPVAHYDLGNALANLGGSEALIQFAEAVRIKPDFAEARYNLGLELAQQGRNAEALEQFTQTVRLRPDFAGAHLNLGVALARERRYAEALGHFQETLRLEPGNEAARKYLDQAVALQKKN